MEAVTATAARFNGTVLHYAQLRIEDKMLARYRVEEAWKATQCPICQGKSWPTTSIYGDKPAGECAGCGGVSKPCPIPHTPEFLQALKTFNAMLRISKVIQRIDRVPRAGEVVLWKELASDKHINQGVVVDVRKNGYAVEVKEKHRRQQYVLLTVDVSVPAIIQEARDIVRCDSDRDIADLWGWMPDSN